MTKAYLLQHVRTCENGSEDVKVIGIYESRSEAEHAVQRLVSKPGFSLYPDGFQIDEYGLNRDGWVEGFIFESEAVQK
jgi:hypothetical protein